MYRARPHVALPSRLEDRFVSAIRSGHYVCYSQMSDGQWRLYDDSRVTRFAHGEARRLRNDLSSWQEPRRDLGRKAYMLQLG